MRKSINKIISIVIATITILGISITGVSASWRQDDTGKWNTEGSSWSIGWKLIDGNWYYFGSDGYMKTGWVQSGEKWYYLMNVTGIMAKDTVVDRHKIDSNGVWIGDINADANSSINNNNTTLKNSHKIPNCDDKYIMTIYYNKQTLAIDGMCSVKNDMGFYGAKKVEKMNDFDYFVINAQDYGYNSSNDMQTNLIQKYKVSGNNNGDVTLIKK